MEAMIACCIGLLATIIMIVVQIRYNIKVTKDLNKIHAFENIVYVKRSVLIEKYNYEFKIKACMNCKEVPSLRFKVPISISEVLSYNNENFIYFQCRCGTCNPIELFGKNIPQISFHKSHNPQELVKRYMRIFIKKWNEKPNMKLIQLDFTINNILAELDRL